MCISPRRRSRGFTLAEMMVAVAIFGILGLALSNTYLFGIRSMAAMANYTALDHMNQQAVDRLTREIRHCQFVSDYQTNSLTIVNGSNEEVTFTFNPQTHQLVRSTASGSTVLLNDCNLIQFNLNQRNPVGGTYDIYPVSTNNWQETAKVINLTWNTSRTLPNGLINSEDIQTARIVIRHK